MKPEIVAFNKLDIPGVDDAFELCKDELAETAVTVQSISAAGRVGLDELLYDVAEALSIAREEAQAGGKGCRERRGDAGSGRGRRAGPPPHSSRPPPQDTPDGAG